MPPRKRGRSQEKKTEVRKKEKRRENLTFVSERDETRKSAYSMRMGKSLQMGLCGRNSSRIGSFLQEKAQPESWEILPGTLSRSLAVGSVRHRNTLKKAIN